MHRILKAKWHGVAALIWSASCFALVWILDVRDFSFPGVLVFAGVWFLPAIILSFSGLIQGGRCNRVCGLVVLVGIAAILRWAFGPVKKI